MKEIMKSLTLVLAVILSGCASVAPITTDHPANPEAEESPVAPAVPMLITEPPAGTVGQPAETPGVYVCPMHPEVVQDQPGTCPKCGMSLMKKKGVMRGSGVSSVLFPRASGRSPGTDHGREAEILRFFI